MHNFQAFSLHSFYIQCGPLGTWRCIWDFS